MRFYCFIAFWFFVKSVQTKDLLTISFIKSYIENEDKPTDLICNNLGWKKNNFIKMAKALSHSSVRSVTLFEGTKSNSDISTLFLIDLDTSHLDVLRKVTSYFRAPFRWLVLSAVEDEVKSEFLWDLPLLLDSDFVLAVRNKDVFTLHELYKPSPDGPTYSQTRGYYNGTFIDTRVGREMYRRRGDVMGHELVMSNVIQDSNATEYHLPREDRLHLQDDAVSKMAWAVGRLAFEMVNATPKYIFNHRYGYQNNGTWSGMINDLITGKAILGTNLLQTFERAKVITYTDTISPFRVGFIFRQPPLANVSNIFALTFSFNVWMATIVCAVISILTLYLDSKWDASRVTENEQQEHVEGKITDAVLITMAALSVQGSSITPRTFSGRLMFWMIFLSMMTIYAAYSANIIVLLQAPSNTIRTFDQLAKSKITLAAEDLDYHRFVFKKNKDVHYRILPKRGKNYLFSPEDCVRKLRLESYAVHGILESFYRRIENTFLETEKCDLTVIDFLNSFDVAAPVNKYTPYLELLKVSFKRIREAGIRTALEKRYLVPKPKCTNTGAAFSSIGVQNIRPVLQLALLGVTVSVLILLLEVIVHKVSIRQQQQQFMDEIRQKYSLIGRK